MSWLNEIGAIAGLIGASAWIPWIYKKYSKPIIKGRLIGHASTMGEFNGKTGALYFLTLNIISLNKSFNTKDVGIAMTFEGSSKIVKGEYFWARDFKWEIGDKTYKLQILPEDTLPFVGAIPAGITKKLYITYIVDRYCNKCVDEIKITLTDYNNTSRDIYIPFKSIRNEQIVWDDRVWELQNKRYKHPK